MSNYIFYFDEAYHDRKITISEVGTLNTQVPNALDNYVGAFWGENFLEIVPNQKLLTELEVKYKKKFGLNENQELKSDIIKPKNYKYGLKSFNKNAFNFYYDFFEVMNNINPILHLSIMSKVELLLRCIFVNISEHPYYKIIEESFYYTLVKFFDVYGNEQLFKSLYKATDTSTTLEFKKELLLQLSCVAEAIQGIERKEREVVAFRNLIEVIQNFRINIEYINSVNYMYMSNFEGLGRLLDELNIDMLETSILIDNEEATFQSANMFNFKSVLQFDSKDNIQLRTSDLLAGFVGRMMYAIANDETISEDKVNDIKNISENDLSTKRLLSKEWFEINDDHFKLYCMIYDLIIEKQQNHWTVMTMTYADNLIAFITLLRYFKEYETFEEYQQTPSNMHAEYYNNYVCHELEERYKTFK